MGSPLSDDIACLFLESRPFKFIILKDSTFLSDVLFIYPQNVNITKITNKLNKIETTN